MGEWASGRTADWFKKAHLAHSGCWACGVRVWAANYLDVNCARTKKTNHYWIFSFFFSHKHWISSILWILEKNYVSLFKYRKRMEQFPLIIWSELLIRISVLLFDFLRCFLRDLDRYHRDSFCALSLFQQVLMGIFRLGYLAVFLSDHLVKGLVKCFISSSKAQNHFIWGHSKMTSAYYRWTGLKAYCMGPCWLGGWQVGGRGPGS